MLTQHNDVTIQCKSFESLSCFSGPVFGNGEMTSSTIGASGITNSRHNLSSDLESFFNQTPLRIKDSSEISFFNGVFKIAN